MVAENVVFGILAAIMAVGAIRVVTTNNIVHAALWLVTVLAGVAGQFLLLGQEFIAWVQVIVYIGAVIVLFLFAIMLTRAPMHPKDSLNNNLRGAGLLAGLLLAGTLGWVLIDFWGGDKIHLTAPVRTETVGNVVFRSYLVPFEVVGVLLLGALIGAVVLARKD
jgi:NADH-quinone oxidoreductase subunit J